MRARWLLLVQLLFCGVCIALGGAVLYVVHGIASPSSSVGEFLRELPGLLTMVGTGALFVIGPVTFLVWGKRAPAETLRARLVVLLQAARSCAILTAGGGALIVMLGLVGRCSHRRPTPFDTTRERCFLLYYRADVQGGDACVAALRPETHRQREDKRLVEMAGMVARNVEGRSGSTESWLEIKAHIEEWRHLNARHAFHSRVALGRTLAKLSQFDAALEQLREADRLAPTRVLRAFVARFRGDVELQRENWFGASDAYALSLPDADAPDRAELINRLAICAFQLRRWDESERFMLRSLELRTQDEDTPRKAMVLSNVGLLRVLQGRADEARAALADSLRLVPDDVVTIQNLAIAETLRNEHQVALQTLARAEGLLRSPTGEDARRNALIAAWSLLRNRRVALWEVVTRIQKAAGVAIDERSARALAADERELASSFTLAADLLSANEGTYGLEFIEAELLQNALAHEPNPARRTIVEARLARMPPSVAQIRAVFPPVVFQRLRVAIQMPARRPRDSVVVRVELASDPDVELDLADGVELAAEPGERVSVVAVTPPELVVTPTETVIARDQRLLTFVAAVAPPPPPAPVK